MAENITFYPYGSKPGKQLYGFLVRDAVLDRSDFTVIRDLLADFSPITPPILWAVEWVLRRQAGYSNSANTDGLMDFSHLVGFTGKSGTHRYTEFELHRPPTGLPVGDQPQAALGESHPDESSSSSSSRTKPPPTIKGREAQDEYFVTADMVRAANLPGNPLKAFVSGYSYTGANKASVGQSQQVGQYARQSNTQEVPEVGPELNQLRSYEPSGVKHTGEPNKFVFLGPPVEDVLQKGRADIGVYQSIEELVTAGILGGGNSTQDSPEISSKDAELCGGEGELSEAASSELSNSGDHSISGGGGSSALGLDPLPPDFSDFGDDSTHHIDAVGYPNSVGTAPAIQQPNPEPAIQQPNPVPGHLGLGSPESEVNTDLITAIAGAMAVRHLANGTAKSFLDTNGNLGGLAETFTVVRNSPYWGFLATEPAKALSVDMILLNGGMHWQVYAALADAVHGNEFSQYGGIKPWIFDELIALGLGYPRVRRVYRSKRPPKLVCPTSWGRRLVELCDQDDRFTVTQAMRDGARYRPIKPVSAPEVTPSSLLSSLLDR